MTLSTKKVTTKAAGSSAGCAANLESRIARSTSQTKHAASQASARLTPSMANAANGVKTAHSTMPLDATNPPSDACRRPGRMRKATNWVVRKTAKRRVLARTRSPATVSTW